MNRGGDSMIKNRKVFTKLLLMITPLVITLVLICIYYSYRQIKIQSDAQEVYFEKLYQASIATTNAASYFYEASLNEFHMYYDNELSDNQKSEILSQYHNNAQRTLDELEKAIAIAEQDENLYNLYTTRSLYEMIHGTTEGDDPEGYLEIGTTIKGAQLAFLEKFDEWQKAYDFEASSGNFIIKRDRFSEARERLNMIVKIFKIYADYETLQIKEEVRQNILFSTLLTIGITMLVAFFSYLVALYFRRNIKKVTNDMLQLSNNDLSFSPHIQNGKDELAMLSKASNSLFCSLRDITSKLKSTSDKLLESSVEMSRREAELFNKYKDHYGYAFFIGRKV